MSKLDPARRAMGDKNQASSFALYELASFRALRGRKREALDYLRRAEAAGDALVTCDLAADHDFSSLHGDPEFERLIASAKSGADPAAEGKP